MVGPRHPLLMVEFQKTLWAGSEGRLLPLGNMQPEEGTGHISRSSGHEVHQGREQVYRSRDLQTEAGPALPILSPDGQATPGASASSSCSPLASGWDRSIGQTDEEGQRFRNLPGGEGASLPTCPGDKQLLLHHPWAQFQGQVN